MSQQTGPSAPDSPALLVTTNVQKYAMKKKKVLSAEESELFELTQATGVTVDQEVFKWAGKSTDLNVMRDLKRWTDLFLSCRIIVDLLKMNVAPQAVFQTLKAMCAGQRVAESCGESSAALHVTSMTTASAEVKG